MSKIARIYLQLFMYKKWTQKNHLVQTYRTYVITYALYSYVKCRISIIQFKWWTHKGYVWRVFLYKHDKSFYKMVLYAYHIVSLYSIYGMPLIRSGDKSPGDKSPRRSIFNTFNTLFLGNNKLKQLKLHKNKATVRSIE